MSAALSQRLTANPVSLSSLPCRSHLPRSPLTLRPFAATVALYVLSNWLHEPGRSLPHVIRMIMSVPPRGYSLRPLAAPVASFLWRRLSGVLGGKYRNPTYLPQGAAGCARGVDLY